MQYIKYNNMITARDESGFFKIEYDQIAIDLYLKEIDEKSMKFDCYINKVKWLVENGYYIDFFQMYSNQFITEISNVVYDYNFKFSSFMAVSKFYNSYSLQTNDRKMYLETYEDRILACSLFLAQGDEQMALKTARAMIEQKYQPATPTFLNSGRKNSGELISCFLLESGDSLNSINYTLSTAMQLSKIGGGVAINLTKLRARNESIKGVQGVARGVLPVMKILEDAFSYVDQLGQRPGAGAVYLNIFHADVLEFLDTKKLNADEKTRIQTLSLGLVVPDVFWKLAKNNEDMYLFYPHNVYQETGHQLAEMNLNEQYDELVKNNRIRKKKVNARDLLQLIAVTQFESGYPYIVYETTANKVNPLSNIGKIKMSNLCTEIFQIQTETVINDYGEDDVIGYDINCNLGSINITNLMEGNDFGAVIDTAMRALSTVSEMSSIKNAPGVKRANDDFHSVGLGAMNLHGYLAKNLIAYESEEAKDFVNTFFMMMNYYSLLSSNALAIEHQTAFKWFEQSTYATGEYFEMYELGDFSPKTPKVQKLFSGLHIPSKVDWLELKSKVMEHGIYNSYRLAVAPTQSISYVQNATAALSPVVDLIETRMYGDSITYYPMPYLSPKNVLLYKSAYNIDQFKMIDLIAVAQRHIDQGISTVLYVDSNTTTKQLAKLYYYAWAKGLKALYYTRTKNLSIDECLTCSV